MSSEKQYDPDMPCNKKGCDASTRASCCGCPEMLEYERKNIKVNLHISKITKHVSSFDFEE